MNKSKNQLHIFTMKQKTKSKYKKEFKYVLLDAVAELYKQHKTKQVFRLLKTVDCDVPVRAIEKALQVEMQRQKLQQNNLKLKLKAVRSIWLR